jgi:hypothetical protein
MILAFARPTVLLLIASEVSGVVTPNAIVRIPIESDHPFRPNPIADSGVSDHLAGAGVS